MEGAVDSAKRAVREVVAAEGARALLGQMMSDGRLHVS